jgi:hypothetical protein
MELSWERPREGWRGISRAALSGWLLFYALFLWHAATNRTGFLLLDCVNLIFHEAGHFFFGWFGYTIGILGGTLGELMVPAGVATYFIRKRATAGTAFASFWFFENFLYVGTYMADARSLALPLVGSGEHDWEILFGQWGVLVHDRAIGGAAPHTVDRQVTLALETPFGEQAVAVPLGRQVPRRRCTGGAQRAQATRFFR